MKVLFLKLQIIEMGLGPETGLLGRTALIEGRQDGSGVRGLRVRASPDRFHAATGSGADDQAASAQHFLYFLPLPQGQGSFLPTLGALRGGGPMVPSTYHHRSSRRTKRLVS